jgi:hypothetical protein
MWLAHSFHKRVTYVQRLPEPTNAVSKGRVKYEVGNGAVGGETDKDLRVLAMVKLLVLISMEGCNHRTLRVQIHLQS